MTQAQAVGCIGLGENAYYGKFPEFPTTAEAGFYLQRFAGLNALLSDRPHRHEFQHICVVQSGYGGQRIDGHRVDFRPDSIYLIAKGHVHVVEEGVDLTGWLIRFTDDFLPAGRVGEGWDYHLGLFNQLGPNRSLSLQPDEMHDLEILLKLLEAECAQPSSVLKQSALRHLLSLLLVRIQRLNEQAVHTTHHDHEERAICQKFMTLLEHNFSACHDVGYYCEQLGVASFRLSKIIGRVLGRRTKQIIEERLVLEGKRYLLYTNVPIKEIASRLGYSDPFHMSKTFKRLVGVTPHAFREQHRRLA
jgi:AraC-like DNA-binding protein